MKSMKRRIENLERKIMEQCESAKTDSASDLGKELNVSEKELASLSEAIGELNVKLNPISLRLCEATVKGPVQPDKARCDIDAAIHSINCRISQQTERIRTMISELKI